MKAMVFVRYLESCRETHYAACWEAKTGNVLTRSTISAEEAVRLHEKKLNRLGITIGQIVKRGIA